MMGPLCMISSMVFVAFGRLSPSGEGTQPFNKCDVWYVPLVLVQKHKTEDVETRCVESLQKPAGSSHPLVDDVRDLDDA